MNKLNLLLILFTICTVANAQWPHKNISQAEFATDVIKRVPQNILKAPEGDFDGIVVNHPKVFFFTNIRNLKGHKISHRWLFDGQQKAKIDFDINGSRWRVWSSKNMWYKWQGLWTVQVILDDNEVIYERDFYYER